MNWGDVPGWAAVGIAVFALMVSTGSAALSWKSLHWERESAQAATRSAEAAERANRLAEEAVQLRLGDVLGAPTDTTPTVKNTKVSWSIEHPAGNRYVLRNTGTDIAEHVEVDRSQINAITRQLPQDAVIRPGEGVDMLILGTWGNPVPNQLYVRWEGQANWVAVPMQ